jgi:hypothetical protein
MGIVDDLVAGREAFERRDWAVARDRLSAVGSGDLGAEDLDALAVASYLAGDRDACVDAWQRAFSMQSRSGATQAAVRLAFWIALVMFTSGNESVGAGWVARAARMLESEPEDSVEHAYIDVHATFRHIMAGELPVALDLATRVSEAGRRFDEVDLLANGLMCQGRILIYLGRVREGLSLLDEAKGCVAGGVLSADKSATP